MVSLGIIYFVPWTEIKIELLNRDYYLLQFGFSSNDAMCCHHGRSVCSRWRKELCFGATFCKCRRRRFFCLLHNDSEYEAVSYIDLTCIPGHEM